MGNTKNNIHLLEVAFKEGDKSAFEALYNIYYDKLFIYINSFTNSKVLSQDLIQDTFIKVWNSRDNFDIKQSLSGYLYKTAYYTFVDTYRKSQKQYELLDTLAYKKTIEIINDDEENQSKIRSIKEAITNLPPKCKEIFLMNKYQGYKYREIAEQLNLSIKTVESQMGRAFSLIRKEVKANGF